ncbi:MAG: DNA-binding transcriptional regulator NtrC [Steroidobacteraceae bacterium]|nr:DNA-binding transcriptional regulator NtrC [Steroidobacteraceae bacterium]
MSAAHILVVDDESDIRSLLTEILSEEGYEVDAAANAREARASRASRVPDLVLLDIWMPDVDGITLLREWSNQGSDSCPVVMMSGHGTVETAVEATRLGAFDFVEKPLSLAKLLRTVERALDAGRRRRGGAGRFAVPPLAAPLGKSAVMRALRAELAQIAHSARVLFVGESGSGREAFARYVHETADHGARPIVTLVASTVRESDPEPVLLGSQQDGQVKAGVLEEAAGGTLFISEIDDLPPAAQRILLGVLETGSFTRVGGSEPVQFSARVLASAQPGIEQRAADGAFRRDLLSQLSTIIVRVPPLREYAEDVPELLHHYVDRLVDAEGLPFRRFGVAAQNRLRNYPWPGNIRELRNLVHRLLLRGGSDEIGLEEVERELAVQAPATEPLVKQDLLALPLREAREQFERMYLQQQLLLCNGKVGQLAKRVGMERTHLYRKLRSLGVEFRSTSDD